MLHSLCFRPAHFTEGRTGSRRPLLYDAAQTALDSIYVAPELALL